MLRSLVLLFTTLSLCWGAEKPDLAGKWELDTAKSKFGKMSKPVRMALVVTRHGEVLHSVQTAVDSMDGQGDVTGDWFLDGKEHPIPNTKMTQMSKWEGGVLTADKKAADGTVAEKITITLSPDGKTATEKVSTPGASGTETHVLVWNRKD